MPKRVLIVEDNELNSWVVCNMLEAHGHTVGALGLSPYKFEHASFGGRGQPPWVAKCPAPDTYRGAHRGPAAAAAYARSVEEACAAGPVAAFFIESGMSVAGVLLPPPGYLARSTLGVGRRGGRGLGAARRPPPETSTRVIN